VIHQKNGGLSAARNTGIDWTFQNSNSEWITFIDSDDWIHPKYLERLLYNAIESNVDVSICGYIETEGETSTEYKILSEAQIWIPEDFYVQNDVNAIIACAKLYRKECFEKVRFPLGRLHEDEFTTYKILFACSKISFIPEPLYFYYVNPHGITKSAWTPKALDSVEAINEQIKFMKHGGFEKGYKKAVKRYALIICIIINRMQRSKFEEKKKYFSLLKKLLRKHLLKYRKMILFQENKWIYEIAYPNGMKLYWISKSLISKVTKGKK